MFLEGHGFSILIQKYVSEEREQIYQFSLRSKTTENNSVGISFAYYISYISIFVNSSFSWFVKLSHLHGEYFAILFLIQHESDLNLLSFYN